MKKHHSRGIYRILRYMSRRSRYPDGLSRPAMEARFDKNILSELIYYDYLEENSAGCVYLTVKGREALQLHILTVMNVVTAIIAAGAAVIALFF